MLRALYLTTILALTTPTAAGPSSRYEELSASELRQAIQAHPVAFLPAGIVEWHGRQSACGLDALKAETLCRMAADNLGGVCFPTLWLGPDASTPFEPSRYPRGTLAVDQSLYFQAAQDVLAGMEAQGFRVVVYLSGHYPGVIPPVAAKFNERSKLKVISVSENQVVGGMPAGDHAAAWETSLLMVLRPGLVDLSKLPSLPSTTRPAGEVIPPPWPFLQQTEYYGVYGADPRIWANATYGRRGTEAVLDGLADQLRKALNDPAYGTHRRAIDWPKQGRQEDEVRYEFQLPHQWLERYETAPVVYWPLSTSGQRCEAVSERCAALARRYGGMVFPAFSYTPGSDGRVELADATWQRVVRAVTDRLADMGFRIVVIDSERAIGSGLAAQMAEPRGPDGRTKVVLLPQGESEADATTALPDAIRSLIPSHSAVERRLEDGWTIDGRYMPSALGQAVYGPPTDCHVYERHIELSNTEAAGAILLDLGTVENWCEVAINGQSVGHDHWPPYRFLLAGRARAGGNGLTITVRHQPQATLDPFFHRPGPPHLPGPVMLRLWTP